MPTYTTPPTAVAGQPLAAADWNTKVRDSMDFLWKPPAAKVYHNAAQSMANNAVANVAFNSERYDNDTIHDNVTNNSRLTCQTAGIYDIRAQVEFAHNVTGIRVLYITLNAITIVAELTLYAINAATVPTAMQVGCQYALSVGDYVIVQVFQNSGVALNIQASNNYSPDFSMIRVGGV